VLRVEPKVRIAAKSREEFFALGSFGGSFERSCAASKCVVSQVRCGPISARSATAKVSPLSRVSTLACRVSYLRKNVGCKGTDMDGPERGQEKTRQIAGFHRVYSCRLVALHSVSYSDGAGGGNRTHTLLPETDFESVASTNSATPALM
jgi:hypothetical protein